LSSTKKKIFDEQVSAQKLEEMSKKRFFGCTKKILSIKKCYTVYTPKIFDIF